MANRFRGQNQALRNWWALNREIGDQRVRRESWRARRSAK
jgi:hypothetical protein